MTNLNARSNVIVFALVAGDMASAASGCEPDPMAPARVCRPLPYLGDFGCPGGNGNMGGAGGAGGGDAGDPGQAGQGGAMDGGSGEGGGSGGATGGAGHDHLHHWPRIHGCSATSTTSTGGVPAFVWFGLALTMLARRRTARSLVHRPPPAVARAEEALPPNTSQV